MDNKLLDSFWVKAAALVAFVVVGLMFSADPEDRYREREAALKARGQQQAEEQAQAQKPVEQSVKEETAKKDSPAVSPQSKISDGPSLASHRGLYDITLKAVHNGSGVTAASGTMAYNFADQCEGWTVENYTRLTLNYGERGSAENDWRFISWEAKDGSRYRFRVRQDQDGTTVEELKGKAQLNGEMGSKGGKAVFVLPDNTEKNLPTGTLFPTTHIRALLAAAEKGQRSFPKILFDGASLENPYEVSALMLPSKGRSAEATADAEKDRAHKYWRVNMAFFHYGAKEAVPAFELSVNYRDDGIADEIFQDFGDFALAMRLNKLEILPKPDC